MSMVMAPAEVSLIERTAPPGPERLGNGVTIDAQDENAPGAAKRIKKTGTGKLKRMRAYKSHILTKKTTEAEAAAFGSRTWCPRATQSESTAFFPTALRRRKTDASFDLRPSAEQA